MLSLRAPAVLRCTLCVSIEETKAALLAELYSTLCAAYLHVCGCMPLKNAPKVVLESLDADLHQQTAASVASSPHLSPEARQEAREEVAACIFLGRWLAIHGQSNCLVMVTSSCEP